MNQPRPADDCLAPGKHTLIIKAGPSSFSQGIDLGRVEAGMQISGISRVYNVTSGALIVRFEVKPVQR